MPKAPATSVVIHRIEFQETERELLKSAMTAYSFRNATKGIFNLTSDATTVVIICILLETVFPDRFKDLVDTILKSVEEGFPLNVVAMALGGAWSDAKAAREVAEGWTAGADEALVPLWDFLGDRAGMGPEFRGWIRGGR